MRFRLKANQFNDPWYPRRPCESRHQPDIFEKLRKPCTRLSKMIAAMAIADLSRISIKSGNVRFFVAERALLVRGSAETGDKT